jgi:nitrate reductase alpha subunit
MQFLSRLLFFLILFASFKSFAQKEKEVKDTVIQKEWGFKTTQDLADTAWWALQQKTTADFMSLVPSLAIIKETFDSLEIKNNPQIIKIKYNNIYFRVTKQLKVLNAKAKTNKLKFKTCEKDNSEIKEGKDSKGNAFAYITINCHKSKRQFSIKFVALELNKNWYIVDELKLEFPEDNPYYKPPLKSPVKIKRKNEK